MALIGRLVSYPTSHTQLQLVSLTRVATVTKSSSHVSSAHTRPSRSRLLPAPDRHHGDASCGRWGGLLRQPRVRIDACLPHRSADLYPRIAGPDRRLFAFVIV
jgi:hypothetical protein